MQTDHANVQRASYETAAPREVSIWWGHILAGNLRRHGVWRVIVGGGSMYYSIPFFVFFHLTVAVGLYQWLIQPLLGLKRIRWAEYVILDRHRIEGMTWFDKFNCLFCGYANGLTTMMNDEMDQLAEFKGALALWKKFLIALVCLPLLPWIAIWNFVGILMIYDILVSRPLRMHRMKYRPTAQRLREEGYAAQFSRPVRGWIRFHKNYLLRTDSALEQIESSWCPLRHLEEREEVVYPMHHEKFYGQDDLDDMHERISTVGTVSDRLPLDGGSNP